MGFLDVVAGWFGKSKPPAVPAKGQVKEKKKLAQQVFEGRCPNLPEWAESLDQSQLVDACIAHAVCKFTPHIEVKKIMSARTGIDGNLEPEYEGIAGGCGAITNFGRQLAQHKGYTQPYRYVDLNHILSCCCDKPRKCAFYSLAMGEDQELTKRMKRVGTG